MLQAFVVFVTMCREAYDDFIRFRRDREVNSQQYKKLTKKGIVSVPSSAIKVSDLIIIEKVGIFEIDAALDSICFFYWSEEKETIQL